MAAAGMLALTLAACVAPEPGVSPPAHIAPSVPLTPSASPATPSHPAPGRTVEVTLPAEVGDLRGVRIATIVPDAGAASRALQEAVREFAEQNGLVVDEFVAAGDTASIDSAFAGALAAEPHVVVGLGAGAVDVFAYNSSQLLDQDFLLLGAQLAEPTANVAAVIWEGATSRGSGAPADGNLEEATVTASRAAEAVAVGLTTVMSGVSGIVLHLPG